MKIRSLLNTIKALFGFTISPSLSIEELQYLFSRKYELFRELLTANSNALEAMAIMEQALHGGRAYSMAFVRAQTTIISVNVYRMVRCMAELGEGRYDNLNAPFKEIQEQLAPLLKIRKEGEDECYRGKWFYPLTEVSAMLADRTGEKMANLGEAGTLDGITIPQGFVVSRLATEYFFRHNKLVDDINALLQQMDSADLHEVERCSRALEDLVINASLPSDLEDAILARYDAFVNEHELPVALAIRSSALGEDAGRTSFAGLYKTELMIYRDNLIRAYKSVIASTFSTRAITYRLTKGLWHEEAIMCVGCLVMVDAVVSGVCYTRSLSGQAGVIDIVFAKGGARGIVEGTRKTTRVHVAKITPHTIIGGYDCKDGVLTSLMIAEIGRAAMILEKHFGTPQDIEWSLDSTGKLYILQSRPITVVPTPESNTLTSAGENCAILFGETTGSYGVAAGEVFIVNSDADMLAFPNKSVLVVEHPLPEWAPLLKKATALIAETGSEAGHLATIAREYGVPALLTAHRARGTLKNGQEVTVDASGKVVYSGRIENLLSEDKPRSNPMDGSPVQKRMIEVLKLVTPLHLTDPKSPLFRSGNCKTLHDITRFCHEKSVIEMFDFGNRYRFDKGAAKRLVDNMPMEWWVINLADGFADTFDHKEKFIDISDITSRPMHAIWEGMHATGWEGPPGSGVREIGAILFQSTRQQGIDPAVASPMSEKNYFLVSGNFCNFSVRLGYHYAMIEAFIGSLSTERYVTFRFKGGAADASRRIERVRLIGEVLQHFGFRVKINNDALRARVERRSQDYLLERLKVLGYLTTHTRQIDMVMNTPGHYNHYREKFFSDLNIILSADKERETTQ